MSNAADFDLNLTTTVAGWNDTTSQFWNWTVNATNATPTASAVPFRSSINADYPLWLVIVLGVVQASASVGTVVGNVLVIVSVSIVKRLRTPSNYLIVSLAVSDLFVGFFVMPVAMTYDLMGSWSMGRVMCDLWTSLDVLSCSASILNLCMISIDRYLVISKPYTYGPKRTIKLMIIYIFLVWSVSGVISIPPQFAWGKPSEDVDRLGSCQVTQNLSFQLYGTIFSFYLPLLIMIVIYLKIYQLARKMAKADRVLGSKLQHHLEMTYNNARSTNEVDENRNAGERAFPPLLLPNVASPSPPYPYGQALLVGTPRKRSSENSGSADSERLSVYSVARRRFTVFQNVAKKNSSSTYSSHNQKATKTLGVIMGCFTLCWLPFFILALVKSICRDQCAVPKWVDILLLWLGYINSTLNPVIYARFNRDFRKPFKEILLCRCRHINQRLRKDEYEQQYGMAPEMHAAPRSSRDHSLLTNLATLVPPTTPVRLPANTSQDYPDIDRNRCANGSTPLEEDSAL